MPFDARAYAREYGRKRRAENPIPGREASKRYYHRNKEQQLANSRKWKQEHPEDVTLYRETHREEFNLKSSQAARVRREKYRNLAIERLSGKCNRCGFSDPRALQFNHINGGGVKEMLGRTKAAYSFYRDIAEGKRPDINLLCANCNWIHRHENKLVPQSKYA